MLIMRVENDSGECEARGAAEPEKRRRDPARIQRLRRVIRYMLERGTLATGDQALLASHFNLSRQRVNQLVRLERETMKQEGAPPRDVESGGARS